MQLGMNDEIKYQLKVKNSYLYGPCALPIGVIIVSIIVAKTSKLDGMFAKISMMLMAVIGLYLLYFMIRWITKNLHNQIIITDKGLVMTRFNTDYYLEFAKMKKRRFYDVRHKRVHVYAFDFKYENEQYIILSQGYDYKQFKDVFEQLVKDEEENING